MRFFCDEEDFLRSMYFKMTSHATKEFIPAILHCYAPPRDAVRVEHDEGASVIDLTKSIFGFGEQNIGTKVGLQQFLLVLAVRDRMSVNLRYIANHFQFSSAKQKHFLKRLFCIDEDFNADEMREIHETNEDIQISYSRKSLNAHIFRKLKLNKICNADGVGNKSEQSFLAKYVNDYFAKKGDDPSTKRELIRILQEYNPIARLVKAAQKKKEAEIHLDEVALHGRISSGKFPMP